MRFTGFSLNGGAMSDILGILQDNMKCIFEK